MSTWAIILAAGGGSRIRRAGITEKKQFMTWRGAPLYWRSAETFAASPRVRGLVFVFPGDELSSRTTETQKLFRDRSPGLPWRTAPGGERRQDSVFNALDALPADCSRVLVHDSARPFFSPGLTSALLAALDNGAKAAIPALPVKDTIKRAHDGKIIETLDRSQLFAVQTPQAFDAETLRRAHERARAENASVTDDASMVEAMGLEVSIVTGEEDNVKITTPEDLKRLRDDEPVTPVTGFGYDLHRYGPGRPLKLGGVPIPGGPEVVAHSDGDVLLHALADAVLGCAGLGDIGMHFPDTDPAYEGVPSGVIVDHALDLARQNGVRIVHADLTVVAQTPKLAPHRDMIRRNVAGLLGLPQERVSVKATTEEGLGPTGEKKAVKAYAMVTGVCGGNP
jgi:2-C-methyl-D-erythritol 4-phosphate cytidylyltransferase/2-C-methyl-D-erythritol 2,4-cyclodiphosphate synthase